MQRLILPLGLAAALVLAACQADDSSEATYTNALIHESSPYLLQHAHNPVNWYPWGAEALDRARSEDKLLVISVGYAACHWCHVMEEESFQDTSAARFMNEHYVSIKVDREERPDVDDVYMAACRLISRQGCGWPLNAIALPDGRPVWVGTYLPKDQWVQTLTFFQREYQTGPDQLNDYAAQIAQHLAPDLPDFKGAASTFSAESLGSYAERLLAGMDTVYGGRMGAPKFPMPNNYRFLLAYSRFSGEAAALGAVTTTLDRLAQGGIYDHLGGGFARYATDERWKVPHFEKMLYDNAQLVSLYAEAYAATGRTSYRRIVEETLAFVQGRLTQPDGGFFSSLDADSEGEEGRYYVWRKGEVDSLLKPEEARLVTALFDLQPNGNWEEGKNILHAHRPLTAVAIDLGLDSAAAAALWADSRAKLLTARQQRPRPRRDEKVLTAWNALMLMAYLDAYQATADETYLAAARQNANFLLDNMKNEDGRLWRNFKDGKAGINAFLDDYALLSQALLGLYEATFEEAWLQHAQQLLDYCLTHFSQEEGVLFYYTSDLDPPLVTRRLELEDNVIASSNSLIAEALHQLGTYFYREDYLERSRAMLQAMLPQLEESPAPDYYGNWAQHLLRWVRPPYEVAIVGPDWRARRRELLGHYLPQAWLLGGATEGQLPLLKNKAVEGETYIYVCQNRVCRLPVQTAAEALAQLQ